MKSLYIKREAPPAFQAFMLILVIFIALAGCGGGDGNGNWNEPGDTTKPTVISTIPASDTGGIPLNASISATFSEEMKSSTITATTFTLKQGITDVPGSVAYSGVTAVFTPDSDLVADTTYTVSIGAGAKDLAGNPLETSYVWSFTTGAALDTAAPTIALTTPLNNAIDVALNQKITARFNEAMDPLTISNSSFTLKVGTTPVAGTVSYSGLTATFTPNSYLASDTTYTANITTDVADLAGNALASVYGWSFNTGASAAQGPEPVSLGAAEDFVILAKAGISTSGATSILGDIGVSPAAASYITGFDLIIDPSNEFSTSSLVTGNVYASDYAAPTPAKLTSAVSDMLTAFTDAAGRTSPDFTELYAGDVSGKTLVPGLYKWGTGLLVTNSGVTISGGVNDVWIFQIAGDLTLENDAIVSLAGNAQPRNIYWQVSGQVSLGTGADIKGNILSQTLISMNTGSSMTGRALAQTEVTLNATTVTAP